MNGSDANEYTLELSPEIASRFLLAVGVGMPARRATCLLELHQHIVKTFGEKRTQKMTRDLLSIVRDHWSWCYDTGRPMRRFSGV